MALLQKNSKIGVYIEERNGLFETRKDKKEDGTKIGSEIVARHIITYNKIEEVYTIYGIQPTTRKYKKREPYRFQYYDLEKLIDFINLVIGKDEEYISFGLFHYEEDDFTVTSELESGIFIDYVLSVYDNEKMKEDRLRELLDLLTGYVE
jgi:hypothetical protein